MLYIIGMDKPNLMESLEPCSGQYSLKADLRLNGWLGVAVAVYLANLVLLNRHPDWIPVTRGLVALTPLVPGLLYLRSWMRFVRDLDEMQRRIQIEAFLFAALGTVVLGMAISTLNAQGVPTGWLKHGLGMGETLMAMLFFWSVGWGVAKCRFK